MMPMAPAVRPAALLVSSTQIIAQVPEPIADAVITDVAVLSAVPSYTQRSLIELTVGTKIRAISGTQRLVQNFVRLLLRTPGSNIFNKTSGGGLTQRIGTNMDNRVTADIAIAIANTKQQIIAAQTPERNIPNEERLLSAEIANINVDTANAAVYVTLLLTSHAGTRSAATLVT